MTIRCLLQTTHAPNVQNNISRCDKIMNHYITKTGDKITEVICNYGKGLTTKSEITANKIKQTLADGNVITYSKNHVGDILVKEGNAVTLSKSPKLWDNLLKNIYKGF